MAPGNVNNRSYGRGGNQQGTNTRAREGNQMQQEWNELLRRLKGETEKGIVKDGILNAELVRLTEEFAEKLRGSGITNSSVRKIYEAFVALRMQMQHEFMRVFNEKKETSRENILEEAEEKAFAFGYPRLLLLKSKSRYILERKKGEANNNREIRAAYEALYGFIDLLAGRVKSRDEAEAMVDLFECVIANLKEK